MSPSRQYRLARALPFYYGWFILGITSITSTRSTDTQPCVSPDSKLVTYTSRPQSGDWNEPQLWTITLDGRLPTQLREGEQPVFSPDGKQILFVRSDKYKESGKLQIWLMNKDGSKETQLTNNTKYDAVDPAWSPDGKWIVFASTEAFDSKKKRNLDSWIMRSDGSRRTQLTTNGSHDDAPTWDRHGTYIYFRSNRGGPWNIWRFAPVLPGMAKEER